jgi:hypothetical protein
MSKCGSKAQRKRIPDGGKHTCCYANLMVMGPKKTPVQCFFSEIWFFSFPHHVPVPREGGDFSDFVLVRRGGRPVIYMVLRRRKGVAVQGTAPGFHRFFSGFKWRAKVCGGGGNRGRRLRRERSVLAEARGFFLFQRFFVRFWLLCIGSCQRTSVSPNLLRLGRNSPCFNIR